ncbi:MAG: hypothetical protein Q4G67_05905 [Actinomycetia bacterium]|nr:hypothetical protein [Actinomycetes bacterium]
MSPREPRAQAVKPVKPIKTMAKARLVGAVIAVGGLVMLFYAGTRTIESGLLRTIYSGGLVLALMAAVIVLGGCVLHLLELTGIALPTMQVGSVVGLLAIGALIIAAVAAMLVENPDVGPLLLFSFIAASMCLTLMVFSGQTRIDAKRIEAERARALR